MSSISQGPVRRWGFYRLHGSRFEAGDVAVDPETLWEGVPGCPGIQVSGVGLTLVPGYWRFRVASGQAYGSLQLALKVKSLGSEDSDLPLRSMSPEVEFFRTDLSGSLVVFQIENPSQILLAVEPIGKKKGGILYPLDFFIERLV